MQQTAELSSPTAPEKQAAKQLEAQVRAMPVLPELRVTQGLQQQNLLCDAFSFCHIRQSQTPNTVLGKNKTKQKNL